MIANSTLVAIARAINTHAELRGCRIGFHGNNASQVLSEGMMITPNYNIIVIIEEVNDDIGEEIGGLPGGSTLSAPPVILNETVVGAELVGVGISCGLTIVSAVGLVGGAAAELPSAGTSTVVVVASWVGLVTQGVQCVNGLVRVTEAARNPHDNSLQRWDANAWYSNTILVVDAIGIISGAAAITSSVASARNLLRLRGALPAEEILQRMTNAQRVAAYRESVRRISENPELAREFEEILRQAGGRITNRLRKNNEVIIRQTAGRVSRMVSENTKRALLQDTKDIILNALGVASSATSAEYVGSASGSVNFIGNLVINIVESEN